MRSQTTCSVSLLSSVYILTAGLNGAGLNGAGLSEVDCSLFSHLFYLGDKIHQCNLSGGITFLRKFYLPDKAS